MAQLSDLLPLVREKCQGMPEQQALDQLKKAYRNFCLDSGYLQKTEKVTREIDGTVTLSPLAGHYIHEIAIVEDARKQRLDKGEHYKVNTSSVVTLVDGIDDAEITYSMVPILPLDDNSVVDDDILRRWPDEIAAGAASLLRLMPGQPWSNNELSEHYRREFIKGHREAFRLRVIANDENQFQPRTKRDFF